MTTKKKKKSQSPNVSRPKQRSTKAARSRSSVKMKSRQSRENEKLRVATPRTHSKWLAQQGIVVPDDLDPSEEEISLDFTTLSNGAVGAIHSRFAVRHAHALYVRAGVATRLLRLRHKHRVALARYRSLNAKRFKTDRELQSAFSEEEGSQTEENIMRLEVKSEILDAVIGGFDDIVKAASREMSRRDSERAPRD